MLSCCSRASPHLRVSIDSYENTKTNLFLNIKYIHIYIGRCVVFDLLLPCTANNIVFVICTFYLLSEKNRERIMCFYQLLWANDLRIVRPLSFSRNNKISFHFTIHHFLLYMFIFWWLIECVSIDLLFYDLIERTILVRVSLSIVF